MPSFLTKINLSSEDAKKYPNVILFGIMNSENMSNHSSTKNFGKLQCKLRPAEVMTFFFGLHLLSGRKMVICGRDDLSFLVFTCCSPENWTSADMMTLEEHILLLRNENMVLLVLLPNFCRHHSKQCVILFLSSS